MNGLDGMRLRAPHSLRPPKKISRARAQWLLLLLFACCGLSSQIRAETSANVEQIDAEAFQRLPELDSDYQPLLDQYLELATKGSDASAIAALPALVQAVKRAPDALSGSALIRKSLPMLLKTSFDADFQYLLSYLYNANDTATVKVLTNQINKMGDSVAASQNYFLLAQYYYNRSNWQGVRAALSKVRPDDLSTGDIHYRQLLMGYALQALKEHREAVKFYRQIPENSPYYAHAKLNQGTAFLRQGWWSDAHAELEAAIHSLDDAGDTDLRDRLLVVLAYSRLNYEFYRDARKTLRRVSLNGAYTNKAMMGLGLAAAYQKDFPGAVNAFKLLSQNRPADLSVDEAHLLLAYALVESGDKPGADVAHTSAIAHFQNKIEAADKRLIELEESPVSSVAGLIEQLNARADEIYGNKALIPHYFLANYQGLSKMQQMAASPELNKAIQKLWEEYSYQLKKMVSTNIELRKSMLESYLSQAKYGKAKLYDK